MHSTDIVGYIFNADTYCPSCIIAQLPTQPGGAFNGWALAAGADAMSTEANLAEIATAFGIDHGDESSYDSGDFPKVIFADQADDDICGNCGEPLIESDDDDSGDGGDDDYDVEAFVRGYVDCALWSSSGFDSDESLEAQNYGPDDLTAEAFDAIRRECRDFVLANIADLAGIDPAQSGHDFWLTRNHHGAGFWDRGLGEVGTRLTAAAHAYGESDLYIGDDDLIHVTP
jgi:hypothetical protein